MAQTGKNLHAMQKTWVQSLGQKNPSEKGKATHYCILAWRISWTEEPGQLPSTGSQRVGNPVTNTSTFSISNKHVTELSMEPGFLPCTQTASRRQTRVSVQWLIGWLGKRACRCQRPFSSLNSDIQIVGVVSGNSTQHLFRMSERTPVFFQKIFSLDWLWDG